MVNLIWRLFIIMVIFLAGVLAGNIFTPKQILQEKDIIAVSQAQTSLDLNTEDSFLTLSQSQNIDEVYLAFLRQSYQRAKKEYEYQLQNLTKNPQSQKDFIKAQKNYLAIVSYIEQTYPLTKEEVKNEAAPTPQATPGM